MTDSHTSPDSQAGPNNVFQQLQKNSLKDNNIPPTPQGDGEEKIEPETSKPQNPKHDTEASGYNKESKPYASATPLYMAILAAFNEVLPELPKAEVLTLSRSKTLKIRISEDQARREPVWWRQYFEKVRLFPWLMGNNPSNWKATFDWLIGEIGMRKVIEGSFTQAPRSEYSPEELREWQKKYTDESGIVDAKALLRDWRERTAATR